MNIRQILEALRLVKAIGEGALLLLRAIKGDDFCAAQAELDRLKHQAAGKAAAASSAATSAAMNARRGR